MNLMEEIIDMGLFDRKLERQKANSMTKEQRIKQKYAIWNYYKKKNQNSSKTSKKKK